MMMSLLIATIVVLLAGVVEVTVGGVSVDVPHVTAVVELLRGADGLVASKSRLLLSVSVQPLFLRERLSLTGGADVAVVSTNALVAVPQPTESTIVAPFFNATPPPLPPIAAELYVLSAVGVPS